jgi:hypothetical protein
MVSIEATPPLFCRATRMIADQSAEFCTDFPPRQGEVT